LGGPTLFWKKGAKGGFLKKKIPRGEFLGPFGGGNPPPKNCAKKAPRQRIFFGGGGKNPLGGVSSAAAPPFRGWAAAKEKNFFTNFCAGKKGGFVLPPTKERGRALFLGGGEYEKTRKKPRLL